MKLEPHADYVVHFYSYLSRVETSYASKDEGTIVEAHALSMKKKGHFKVKNSLFDHTRFNRGIG